MILPGGVLLRVVRRWNENRHRPRAPAWHVRDGALDLMYSRRATPGGSCRPTSSDSKDFGQHRHTAWRRSSSEGASPPIGPSTRPPTNPPVEDRPSGQEIVAWRHPGATMHPGNTTMGGYADVWKQP